MVYIIVPIACVMKRVVMKVVYYLTTYHDLLHCNESG